MFWRRLDLQLLNSKQYKAVYKQVLQVEVLVLSTMTIQKMVIEIPNQQMQGTFSVMNRAQKIPPDFKDAITKMRTIQTLSSY
jgi:hypothetical protein